MKIRNNNILHDEELSKFIEELDSCDMPYCFEDSNYTPSEEDIKSFTNEQLEYLKMSVNEDESDAIYEGGALYEAAHKRCLLVKSMIKEELKRRNKI